MSSDRRDPGRWSRIEHLFDQAIELEPSQRAEFLCRATADEELYREVEALLRATEAPGPLDQPVGVLARGLTLQATSQAGGSALQVGKTVGSWRILDSLGEGGMGRVFLAERREGGFDQIAALKLLRWELASDGMVERFRNEQRLLARLEHPGIARLIDGGVSEEGLPYLVMERVEGRPIDDHCQETNASLEERLRLFAQVCDAVQAAHRRLIIHRDLKPSNLLVTRAGQVKVLDFGVAKLLSESGDGLTRTHLAPATPGYAAPEQLTGDEVTTATDVYTLGVLLHRLLTDVQPLQIDATSAQVAQIFASDPVAPSQRLTGARAAALRGDLDNIILTALRREPDRRYPSVDRLAADVRRYLEGKPVDATPETLSYRLAKFVRRNRLAAVASSLALAGIASGLVATGWQARRARQEAAKATQIADFLSGLLSSTNPYDREGRAHSLEDVLLAAADRLELEPLDDPEVRAALQTRIGIGYYRLLRRDAEAWELLSRAERELEPRGESAELANLRLEKALLASERGDYEVQRRLARQAKSFFTRVEGPGSPGVARALLVEALAFQYQGDLGEANRLALESIDLVGLLANPPPLLRAQALATLGTIAELQQRGQESIDLNRRALAIFEELGGPSDPDVIALYDEIGISYHALGRYEEAERFYRKAIELHQARFGADHPNAIDPLTDLSRLLLDQGRFEEALVYAGRAVVAGSGLPESDYERIATQINLATAELETGAVESAASRYRTALQRFRALLGDEHPAVARARSLLADAVRAQGDLEQAELLYRLALHPENRRLEEAWLGLGRVLADTDRPAEARELFEKALDRRLETHPDGHWRVVDVEAELALLAVKEDGNRAAIADLEQAVADLEIDLGSGNWRLERLGG